MFVKKINLKNVYWNKKESNHTELALAIHNYTWQSHTWYCSICTDQLSFIFRLQTFQKGIRKHRQNYVKYQLSQEADLTSVWNRLSFQFLEDVCPFSGATDTPVLDPWHCLPWVSKSGWIPSFCAFHGVCNGFLRFTSSVTPTDLLMASTAAKPCICTHTDIDGTRTWDQVCSTVCTLTVWAIPVDEATLKHIISTWIVISFRNASVVLIIHYFPVNVFVLSLSWYDQ